VFSDRVGRDGCKESYGPRVRDRRIRKKELDPNLAIAHGNLAETLFNKGQDDEAISELRKAIELDPNLVMAHNNLGGWHYHRGQLDEAMHEPRFPDLNWI